MKINKSLKASQDDYSYRIDPDYRRQDTSDEIYDRIKNTNWSRESEYHNTYRVNGNNTTKTLRMSNKKWHQLNKIK